MQDSSAKSYRFRVLIDHEEDVFRDVEIRSDQTFLDLHQVIQTAFEFDNSQMASFYLSNEDWDKGEEIPMMDMGSGELEVVKTMDQVQIDDQVTELDQKLLYVFDFLLMWCFYVELVRIDGIDQNSTYPKVVRSFGKAPEQYSKEPEESFGEELDLDMDTDDQFDIEEGDLDTIDPSSL